MKGFGTGLFLLAYFAGLVALVAFVSVRAYIAAIDAAWDEASFWMLVFIAVCVALPSGGRKP